MAEPRIIGSLGFGIRHVWVKLGNEWDRRARELVSGASWRSGPSVRLFGQTNAVAPARTGVDEAGLARPTVIPILDQLVELTPEIARIVRVGGLQKTYPIAAFLALNPANLSWGFRVNSTFGIDYRHQAECAEEIPRRLREHIFRGLVEMIGHEPIRSLKVEFKAAGASSLDYEILGDFDGAVADKLEMLRRALQRFAVEACNEHGWTIPFTQVTLHQAREESSGQRPTDSWLEDSRSRTPQGVWPVPPGPTRQTLARSATSSAPVVPRRVGHGI